MASQTFKNLSDVLQFACNFLQRSEMYELKFVKT